MTTDLYTTNPIPASPDGNLAAAQRAGFNSSLLIPLSPLDAVGIPEKDWGKRPARVKDDGVSWYGLTMWSHGTSANVREQCDAAGANAGLVLGNPLQKFLALDFDLDGADLEFVLRARDVVIDTLGVHFPRLWFRDTRPGRSAILVRIPSDQEPGGTYTYTLHHETHGAMGKAEILAHGDQLAFVGKHRVTREAIAWWRYDDPDATFRAPMVDVAGIPILRDRAAVESLLGIVLEALAEIGITHTGTGAQGAAKAASGKQPAPENQAAPSTVGLINLLKRMPNPASAGRDVYLSVMNGTAGCIRAGKALKRISPSDEKAIIEAAAEWAGKWEGPSPSSAPVEEAKLRSDFLRQGIILGGWQTLVDAATGLGVPIRDEIAADEFDAVPMTEEEIAAEALKAEEKARAAEAARKSTMRHRLIAPPDCAANTASGDYIIKRMLHRGNVACFFGHPGSGKSVIGPHIGYAVAQGVPLFGMKTKACNVLYATAEDFTGMKRRIDALYRKHGDAPFRLVDIGNLLDEKEAAELVALASDFGLVIIDTLAAAWAGIQENESEGMGKVIALARKIASSGAAVILIHHPAKNSNNTPRGHGSLDGTLEFSMFIPPTPADGIIRADVKKNKNGPLDLDIAFSIKAAELGIDEDGDTVTAPIAGEISGQGRAAVAVKVKLSPGEQLAHGALEEALKGSAADCAVAAWRKAYYDRRSGDPLTAMEKGFERARAALLAKGVIEMRDGFVWLRSPWTEAGEFSALEVRELHDVLVSAPPSSGAIH